MENVPASLDEVLITADLAHRPAGPANYGAESRALAVLADAMADSPQTILKKLVETALDLCRADSARARVVSIGMIVFASYTVSRRKSRARLKPG